MVQGQVALISGGAGGIGQAIARAWVREGGSVMLADLQPGPAKALGEELGSQVAAVRLDATSETDWDAAVAGTVARFGRLDAVVHACGAAIYGPIETLGFDAWRRCFAINLDSIFLGTKAALEHLEAGGRGSVITFSSTMGVRPRGELPAYATAKGAVIPLTRSLAIDFAGRGKGVRVNAIVPGAIRTEMSLSVMRNQVAMGAAGSLEEVEARFASTHPMNRIGDPAEIAEAVLFLCSDKASFITGIALPVDGGYVAL